MKYIYFNGLKFTRDNKTGYYLNTTIRKRIHRYVWEFYNGEIPKGYEIHHIDYDKSNNDISNLQMLTKKAHMELHGAEFTTDRIEKMRKNLKDVASPEASKWHGSEKGREWHKKHYEQMKDSLHAKKEFECKCCGEKFTSIREGFCSNKCKSKYRRDKGLDNIEITCPCCGNVFTANKYAKRVTCSKSCSNRYRSIKKQGEKSV